MAGAPRLTTETTAAEGKNISSHEAHRALEEEHEAYQLALLRHMTLHAAWEAGKFTPDMSNLYDHVQATLPPAKAQSPEYVTAAMVEQAFVNPEVRFPDVAQQVRETALRQDPTGLLELLDHDQNAKLASLSEGSKKDLIAIAENPTVRRSIQFDMLHEHTFGVSSSEEGGSLRSRMEHWIERGLDANLAASPHRASLYAAPLAGLAGGPMALAGMGVTMAAQKTIPFLSKLVRKGLRGAQEHVATRMSLKADRILLLAENIGEAFTKNNRRKTAASTALSVTIVGAMGILGYSSYHLPGLGDQILESYEALSRIDMSLWELMSDTPKESASEAASDGKTSRLEKARAAQAFLVGSILTGITSYLKSQSRLNVAEAGSFFKKRALNMGTPTIDLATVDGLADSTSTTPLWASPEERQAEWRQRLAQSPASPDYQQATGLLQEALERMDQFPREAACILALLAPQLPQIFDKVAKGHEALIAQEGLGRLARRSPEASRAILDMATPDDVAATFLGASGLRRTPAGSWEADDRIGAGRHRARVASQLRQVAELTTASLASEQLGIEGDPAEPTKNTTVVTNARRNEPSTPGL